VETERHAKCLFKGRRWRWNRIPVFFGRGRWKWNSNFFLALWIFFGWLFPFHLFLLFNLLWLFYFFNIE